MNRNQPAIGMRYAATIAFALGLVAISSPAAKAATAALVDFDGSALGKVLEARLLQKPRIHWVERTEIDKVLQEQKLQTLFSAEGLGDRRALGRLIHADVLVLLRKVATSTDDPRAQTTQATERLDLVVCETKQGLRLATYSLPVNSPTPTSESELIQRLEARVDEALRRVDRPAQDIVAVPALVSQDLTFEHDHLKRAFANLIEQAVFQRGDLAVVELAEAEALAKEQALAANDVKIIRRLPLYLLGEYRHDGEGTAERLTVRLKLMRGEQLVASAAGDRLPSSDAPAFLQRTVGELLDNVSPRDAVVLDSQTEAKQLTARAHDLTELGAYEDALPLLEASLLLRPGDEPTRRQAIILCGAIGSRRHRERLEPLTNSMHAYHRGLEHLEIWYAGKPDVRNLPRSVGQQTFLGNFSLEGLLSNRPRNAEAAMIYDEMKPKIEAIVLRIGRLRASQGETDGYYYFHLIANQMKDSRKRFEWIGDRILELQDLPNAGPRTERMAVGGRVIAILGYDGGAELLDRLARDGNADVQQAAARLKQQFEADRAKGREPEGTIAGTFQFEPKLPQGSTRVEFRPITLQLQGSQSPFKFSGLIPAGPGTDVLWYGDTLYVMKQPGLVRQVWQGPALNDSFSIGRGSRYLAFDGRYVWITMWRHRLSPLLLVLDPQSETVRDITAELTLPMATAEELAQGTREHYLGVAPLGPGRACVVGTFGRAWVAKVVFDPAGKHIVRVFHEFRRAPDAINPEAWRDVDGAFRPTFMTALGGPDPETQRVLVGRSGRNVAILEHPLLVDPERETVEVLAELFPDFEGAESAVAYDGRLYYLGWQERALGLFRLGPPTWKPETLQLGMPQGNLRILDGRVHVIGKRWWAVDLENDLAKPPGPYVAESTVPWYFENRWVYPGQTGGTSVKVPPDVAWMSTTVYSGHYGIVVSAGRREPTETTRYQVVVRPGNQN